MLGLVYWYFGFLKLFPDLSPGELLAGETLMRVTLYGFDFRLILVTLAVLECVVGAFLILNLLPRVTFVLFLTHMAGTFLPLFLVPELTFKIAPFAPTLEGQYILKNLVFVAAGWTVLSPQVFPAKHPAGATYSAGQTTTTSPVTP